MRTHLHEVLVDALLPRRRYHAPSTWRVRVLGARKVGAAFRLRRRVAYRGVAPGSRVAPRGAVLPKVLHHRQRLPCHLSHLLHLVELGALQGLLTPAEGGAVFRALRCNLDYMCYEGVQHACAAAALQSPQAPGVGAGDEYQGSDFKLLSRNPNGEVTFATVASVGVTIGRTLFSLALGRWQMAEDALQANSIVSIISFAAFKASSASSASLD